MNKKILIIIGVIIAAFAIILIVLRIMPMNNKQYSETEPMADNDVIIENEDIEIGTTMQRGFIIDNIFHSETQGDIHFALFYPENYDQTKEYAIYFALPGWEGLYFQGIGANMGEPFPYEAQKYNKDMIIISPQLDDWGEESANDTIALVEYFLNNVKIDKYIRSWKKWKKFCL